MANQNKKLKIFAMVVSVLFVLALGYIVYGVYSNLKLQQQSLIFNQGVEQTIGYIVQQAGPGSCQPVQLNVGNQTINLVAMECYSQAPAGTSE